MGVGTAFYVYLPASMDEMQKRPANKESTEQTSIKSKGRILLMDDDDIVRLAIGKHLKHRNYDVEKAKDGTEAITIYKKALESHKPFDAVVMDLTIPGGLGGKEAIKKLLEIDPKVKAFGKWLCR